MRPGAARRSFLSSEPAKRASAALIASALVVSLVAIPRPEVARGATALDIPVASSADDAEEAESGAVSLTSGDLELVNDGPDGDQVVGIRFVDLPVPQGARIDQAHIQFTVDEPSNVATSLTINVEVVDDASGFLSSDENLSSRTRSATEVAWTPPEWVSGGDAGPAERTPDLSSLVQEIVDRPGWQEGNALAFIITGIGLREAESFDGGFPPVLHIEITDTVVVNASDDLATEGADPADVGTLVFTRSGDLGSPLVVDYSIAGTATPDIDYTSLPGTVTIPAGASSTSVDVVPLDDSEVEGIETVEVTVLDGVSYVAGSEASAIVTIADSDLPAVTVSATDHLSTEGAISTDGARFIFLRTGQVDAPLPVSYSVAGTASNGLDYDSLSGSITIPAGASSAALDVTPLDDTETEDPETVIITVLDTADHVAGSPSEASAFILDNEVVIDQRIGSSADDAEESQNGTVDLDDGTLEITEDQNDAHTVGLRFADLQIPQGSAITEAWIRFQVADETTGPSLIAIDGQSADHALQFSGSNSDVSSRARTASAVSWSPQDWPNDHADGPAQTSPDLSSIVQEIVDRPGWNEGNAIAFVLTGTGTRVAEAFDSDPAAAALLHIEFAGSDAPSNQPPRVETSGDSVFYPQATVLGGSVSDDALPDPTAALSASWSVVSGPGSVTFADPTSVDTTATFSTTGVYVLRLTVSDGALAVSDDVRLTVVDPQTPQPGQIRTVAFGDYGAGCCGEADVASLVATLAPDFIITTGDNRYVNDMDWSVGQFYSDYVGNYQGSYGAGANLNRFFPSIGNHDYSEWGGIDVYLDYFTLPGGGIETTGTSGNERYYDFIQGPVHFFVVNSDDREPDGNDSISAQAQWLQTQMGASTSPWQVVYMHHAPYSSGSVHGSDPTMQWPFESWGADAVLAGHDHVYERLTIGSIPYFVVGNGGAGLYDKGPGSEQGSEFFYSDDHGALVIDACSTNLSFEFHSVSAGLIDSYSMGSAPCSLNPPSAIDDSTTTPEDTPVNIDVLSNDTDPDGDIDPASLTIFADPTSGGAVVLGDGTVDYTPSPDFWGSDSFEYEVCDIGGLCDTALVSVTVDPVNDPPIARDDNAATSEGTPVTIAVLSNDSDVEGSTLAVTGLTQPGFGSVVLNGDGSVTYTPSPGFDGDDTFTYQVDDGALVSGPGTVTVTVESSGSCNRFVAVDGADTGSGTPDSPWATLQHAAETVGDLGCTVWVRSGTYEGTNEITRRFASRTVFRAVQPYGAVLQNDGLVLKLSGAKNVEINGFEIRHKSPAATGLVVYVDQGDGLWAEDIVFRNNIFHDSYDNDLLKLNNGARGVVVEGNIFYNQGPSEDQIDVNGVTDVVIQDNVFFHDYAFSGRGSVNAKHFIVVKDSTATVPGARRVKIRRNVFLNWQGGTETFVQIGADGLPYHEAVGVEIFNNLMVGNTSNQATAALGVAGASDVSFVNNTVTGDLPALAYALRVDRKGSNPENGPIDLHNNIWSDPTGTMDDFSGGVTAPDIDLLNNLYWNDGQPLPDGDVVAPSIDDPQRTVADPGLGSPSPAAPPAWDGSVFQSGSTTIRQELVRLVESHGAIAAGSPGTGGGLPAEAPVTDILGRARDSSPDLGAYEAIGSGIPSLNASDDLYTTPEDTDLVIVAPGVLDNDISGTGAMVVTSYTQPSGGLLVMDSDGSLVFTPDPDTTGSVSFTYVAGDGAATDQATVTITIDASNDSPVAADDSYSTPEDVELSVASPGVLGNDSDLDGDSLTAAVVAGPSNGTLVLGTDGSFEYTPDPEFNGVDTFTYEVSDGLATDTAVVTVTVNPVNDAPVADAGPDDSEVVGVPVMLDGSGSVDIDGDPLTYSWTIASQPAGSSSTLGDPSVVGPEFTPDVEGDYVFDLVVNDGLVDSAADSVTITVLPEPNNPPVAGDDSYSTDEDTPLNVVAPGVLSNDTDLDGGGLSVVSSTQPSNGSVTVDADGSFTYTPNADFNGSDSFTYDVSDGFDSDTATVSITVNPVNDPPVAADDQASTTENTAVTVDVTANDSDVDGNLNALTVMVTVSPINGTAQEDGEGGIVYTPAPGQIGEDTFTYQVCDTGGLCDSAAVTVDVAATQTQVLQYALSEVTLLGSATGDLSLTQAVDGVYEELSEEHSGGRPQNRRSHLEHRWWFDVQRGDGVVLRADVYRPNNPDGDDFVFEVSTDGGLSFEPMFTVGSTTTTTHLWALPSVTSGEVVVRVVDSDSSVGSGSTDSVFVDMLRIETTNPQPPLPEVTVSATDSTASESGDPGMFTLSRSDSSGSLVVDYTLEGSASEGVDYEPVTGSVTFTDGEAEVTVSVVPIDDLEIEGDESVELVLSPGTAYQLGVPSSATVVITDDDNSGAESRAQSESTPHGSVITGDYTDTHFADGVVEVIEEELYAGQKRSRLEHQWVFQTTGSKLVFNIIANRVGPVNESVSFSYSVDGSSWTLMPGVVADGTPQSFAMPASSTGTILVRVTDDDSSRNEATIDRIAIDEMFFLPAP